jgi:methionyl-tRNA synthetase
LIREISFGEDGAFSEESLRTRLNTELADVLGNFVHRVLSFIWDHFDGKVPKGKIDGELEAELRRRIDKIEGLLERLEITQALEGIMAIAGLGNEYFQSREPWKVIKTDPQKAADCLLNCINMVQVLCIALFPFMPSTCERLAGQLNIKVDSWERAKKFGIEPGHVIQKPTILFSKIQAQPLGREGRVSMDDFNKFDIRICKIAKAEKIAGSKKLLKLELELPEGHRTIVAGLAEHYSPEDLVGKCVAVVLNMEPVQLMGVKSEGMLLAAEDKEIISVLTVDKPVKPGAKVR